MNAVSIDRHWLLLAVFGLGLGLRLLSFNDPWGADFPGVFGAFATGEPAQNLAVHGFREANFMPYYGRAILADGTVFHDWYTHHPALFYIISGLSLRIFGMQEWALRLPPLLFSLLSLLSGYRFVALVWNRRAAMLSLLFLAVLPMATYYGVQTYVESALVWLYFFVLQSYVKWLREERWRHLVWGALGLMVGGLMDWPMAFLLPVIGLHVLLVKRGSWRLRLRPLILLTMGTGTAVVLHALHLRLNLGSEGMAVDTGQTLQFIFSLPMTVPQFLWRQVQHFHKYFTLPVILLLLPAVWLQIRWGLQKQLSEEKWLLPLMVIPPLCYVGLAPGRSHNHDFFQYYALPFVAIGLAVAIDHWLKSEKWQRGLVMGMTAVTCIWCGVQSVQLWRLNRTTAVREVATSPQFTPILHAEQTIIVTQVGYGALFNFYASTPFISEVSSVAHLHIKHDQVLNKLWPGQRVLFLFDRSTLEQPATAEYSGDLHTFLSEHAGEVTDLGFFDLFDITEWAYSPKS